MPEQRKRPGRPEQEGFGQAGLGEAQPSNPPLDPEMPESEEGEAGPDGEAPESESAERGEGAYDDQDAGPAFTEEQARADRDRDQAEG